MTARAAHEGNVGSLPMIARPAAQMYRLANATNSRMARGFGTILDEMSAKAMAERGTKAKLGAAMNFLLDPRAHRDYDSLVGAHGMIPRLAYHTVPYALPAAAGAGAGYAFNGE